jgi:hypothetical protein
VYFQNLTLTPTPTARNLGYSTRILISRNISLLFVTHLSFKFANCGRYVLPLTEAQQ